MRDTHGRYKNTKPILELGPEWAHGCDACTYGLVYPPALTGAASLSMERLVQAIDKQLVFCTCQAGVRYRSRLLNLRQKLIEEARHDSRMNESAQRLSHPDIENARYKMMAALAKESRVPTIHYEGAIP